MEARVKKLEEKVEALATDVAVIKSNYATKQDVQEVRTEIVAIKKTVENIESNYATKLDVEKLNTSIEAVKVELHLAMRGQTRWMISVLFIMFGTGISLVKFLF